MDAMKVHLRECWNFLDKAEEEMGEQQDLITPIIEMIRKPAENP